MSAFRHPVIAVSHGPGPLWLLDSGFDGMNKTCFAARNLGGIFKKLYPKGTNLPKRILYVSAHWESESSGFEISNAAKPDMIYDYYGFPSEAYDVVYPAKGDPTFAQKVKEHLEKNSIKAKLVDRGFDHGVFVPMLLIRPEADIPIVTMSINSNLATHNMRASRDPNNPLADWAAAFQGWLDNTLTSDSKLSMGQREDQITNWQAAPAARLAHPSPDHFVPFVVAAGAGMEESKPESEKIFGSWGMGHMSFATYAWGVDH
ncbi:hypothetical protein BBO99_00000895 [Phytophthora kernoviae]|uniref:Extradiol ring-cleavage dioxygenase class III enzyme subunit B domain-containing protein n=1 Tax=Phytophthora kernoviae TaxID=325452 RepID=A0A421FCU0_9STRA|nr:hypothetical protein JM16_000775 [Phytophthora kernoviae]RLN37738.1 hypothetical protein BBI17_000797 [Phytophthora kernoviae]RLN84911.1 hypothetical protein BBO99_00000895 [Phytophthora kernoviae]